jgi:DMSO/TMAO reductase YedYZ molybdopterin-dependent catalytic subunit
VLRLWPKARCSLFRINWEGNNMPDLQRREFLVHGSAALTGITALFASHAANAFPTRPGEEVIPWLDQPDENPDPVGVQTQLVWEDLDSWITPNEEFFSISHFNRPVIDEKTWSLEIAGLVEKPQKLTLADIAARPRQDVTFTIECSGNHGFGFFTGGIGNALWTGTPLAPILEEAGVLKVGIEVVFIGTDQGDITVRDIPMKQDFARSMSLADAMNQTICSAMK